MTEKANDVLLLLFLPKMLIILLLLSIALSEEHIWNFSKQEQCQALSTMKLYQALYGSMQSNQ